MISLGEFMILEGKSMFNSWMVAAPTVLVIVWACAYFLRKELVACPIGRKYWRRGTSAFCGVGLLILLHLESHRGGVQLLRNWSNDPNGNHDCAYALATSCAFILVVIFYAYVMSFGIEHIVGRFAKKTSARHLASASERNSQPSAEDPQPASAAEEPNFWMLDGSQSRTQYAGATPSSQTTPKQKSPRVFEKPILVIDEFSAYSLGSLAIALKPGQQRIYNIPCKQRYIGKYEITEEEYLFLMMTLPNELWGEVEVEDIDPQQ